MIDTAVIMAAGLGSRFGRMTETMPKGFIPVGGKAMVLRSIETLLACGIKRIIIGTGYKHETYDSLVEKYPQIECVYSERYAETNSMYTLYNCREAIGDSDFLLLESDIIYGSNAITKLISDNRPDIMLITPTTKFQDQYYVEYDDECRLTRCSTDKSTINVKGELVGIHKLSASFFKKMCDEYSRIAEKSPKLGYEYQLLDMSQRLMPMFVLNAHDVKWYEIDDELDLKYAEENVIPYI